MSMPSFHFSQSPAKVDNQNVAVEQARIDHEVASEAHKEGRRRMLDQELVEIELAFQIVIGRRRKPRRDPRQEKGQSPREPLGGPKNLPDGCGGIIGNENITGTPNTASQLGQASDGGVSLRSSAIERQLRLQQKLCPLVDVKKGRTATAGTFQSLLDLFGERRS